MTIVARGGRSFAVLDPEERILEAGDFLDRMAEARFGSDCAGMVARPENLGEAFFRLRTGFAGELLQKCSNYGFQFAVVGDFSDVESGSLRDFIYECNQGRLVCFKDSLESALAALARE